MYATIPSLGTEFEPIVISVGSLHGGSSANVIPDEAYLSGTLRTLRRDVRQTALQKIERIGEELFEKTGCEVDWKLGYSAPSVVNNEQLVELVSQAARQALGGDAVTEIEIPSMGGEDFSYYLEHVPGALTRLGSAGEHFGRHPLHSPYFDIDEAAIQHGVKLLVASVIEYFAP